MLQRRGTASQWSTANTVLGVGEIGFAYDTNVIKIDFKNNPNVCCPLQPDHRHKSNCSFLVINLETLNFKFKCYSSRCIGKHKLHYLDVIHETSFDPSYIRDICEEGSSEQKPFRTTDT